MSEVGDCLDGTHSGVEASDLLGRVVAHLATGEARAGQIEMCAAVHEAIVEDWHLVAQAGTGTGKSLAYLVPAIMHDGPVVVATATKALQDQLLHHDIPLIAEALDRPIRAVTLKGRSNYLCQQKLKEATGEADKDRLVPEAPCMTPDLAAITEWADVTETGDRAEMPFEPSTATWDAVSISGRECPGKRHCPSAKTCFAERAKTAASEADVVVVNTHLYCLDALKRLPLLPMHDVVVIDEAHELAQIASQVAGVSVSVGRFKTVARLLAPYVGDDLADEVVAAGDQIDYALFAFQDRALPSPLPTSIIDASERAIAALADASRELADQLAADRALLEELASEGEDDTPQARKMSTTLQRKQRAHRAARALKEDLGDASSPESDFACWVETNRRSLVWRATPIEIADTLRQLVWPRATAVLCSATIPPNFPQIWGLDAGEFEVVKADSPFDYQANSLLYVPSHLPKPGAPKHEKVLYDEIEVLIDAARGRTLVLFTSYRAMDRAATELRGRLRWNIYTQRDLPKPELLRRFAQEAESCLFGVASLWQGVDIPGDALSLLIITRLPFPRPDDPLLAAKRARYGEAAFREIDLPIAATKLAQGIGRLIRTTSDKGVVAVLDSRLANARYRGALLAGLPPFPKTRDRQEAEDFLADSLAAAVA